MDNPLIGGERERAALESLAAPALRPLALLGSPALRASPWPSARRLLRTKLRACAGARSAPASLLHPWKGSSAGAARARGGARLAQRRSRGPTYQRRWSALSTSDDLKPPKGRPHDLSVPHARGNRWRTRGGLARRSHPGRRRPQPNPAQRVQRQTSTTPGPCYTSHNPSIPAAGHDFRRIDEPPSGNRLEWDDAAIGAGGVPRLVLAFASGVAAITFRHRRAEVLEMS